MNTDSHRYCFACHCEPALALSSSKGRGRGNLSSLLEGFGSQGGIRCALLGIVAIKESGKKGGGEIKYKLGTEAFDSQYSIGDIRSPCYPHDED